MPQARLRALQQNLQTLVDNPEPRALVVACADPEVFYIAQLLSQMDEQSPSDRFCILTDAFKNAEDHADSLESMARAALDLSFKPSRELTPAHRILAVFEHLLTDLPPGDHYLIIAIVPSEIVDSTAFSAIAGALLNAPLDRRLRLVIRDDRLASQQLFKKAAESSSEQIFACTFAMPPEVFLTAATGVAHDQTRPSDERALALIQLACHDLGHGHFATALARCQAVAQLPAHATLQALALAIQADAMRGLQNTAAATALGLAALSLAVDNNALPVVQHAALALGDLLRQLGRIAEATACIDLAERASPPNPDLSAHIRSLRAALTEQQC